MVLFFLFEHLTNHDTDNDVDNNNIDMLAQAQILVLPTLLLHSFYKANEHILNVFL